MKKLEPRRYVIIGDTAYYHGDYVNASILDNEDEENDFIEVEGRICINKTDPDQQGERHFHFWICQDKRDGCHNADEKFEFQYSWSVQVHADGSIKSTDTEWINLERRVNPELEVDDKKTPTPVIKEDADDDPMPPDWTPSEKDLMFLKG